MDKQAREILAAMIKAEDTGSAIGTVDYVPGREHDTNSEARTRWSFQQYRPATVGLKSHVRVTAPVKRLIAAGYVTDADGDQRVQLQATLAGRAALAAPATKVAKLTPAMERVMRAVEAYGNFDPIRDGRKYTGTVVALMERGLLRESRHARGIHFPATTPEQVWDEAHAENDRRDAERAAHAECAEQWLTAVDGDGRETHTRNVRTGGTIRIHKNGFRHWAVVTPGQRYSMSAGGTWQEARRAADRFERERVHAEALAEDDGRAAAVMREQDEAFAEAEGWGQPDGMLGATEAELVGIVRGVDGMARAMAAKAMELRAQQAIPVETHDHSTACEPCRAPLPKCVHGYAVPTIETCPDGCKHANTPAEARTGISDRAAAALADVAELRRVLTAWDPAAFDRIEAALRERGSA